MIRSSGPLLHSYGVFLHPAYPGSDYYKIQNCQGTREEEEEPGIK